MRVRIVQLLCPKRHAILAIAYETARPEADPAESARLRRTFALMTQADEIDPACGICGSRDLATEDAPTRFCSMKQARPYLAEEQRRNLETGDWYRLLLRRN